MYTKAEIVRYRLIFIVIANADVRVDEAAGVVGARSGGARGPLRAVGAGGAPAEDLLAERVHVPDGLPDGSAAVGGAPEQHPSGLALVGLPGAHDGGLEHHRPLEGTLATRLFRHYEYRPPM